MPNVGTCHDSFSSSSSTEVRPKRSYEIELGDEIVGEESVRYEVAGLTLLIESLLGWLSTVGSGEDYEVIVSN